MINEIYNDIHKFVSKLFRAYGLYNTILNKEYEKMLKVSKLFRAYGLYNSGIVTICIIIFLFQSSFELTGYITTAGVFSVPFSSVSKLFRAYGLYNGYDDGKDWNSDKKFQSSFELTGYITI